MFEKALKIDKSRHYNTENAYARGLIGGAFSIRQQNIHFISSRGIRSPVPWRLEVNKSTDLSIGHGAQH